MKPNKSNYILLISSYPPRECGIATFTHDLCNAFDKKFNPITKTKVCALNEQPTSIYNYPNNVSYQISAAELENYVSFAKKINASKDIRLVNIQHEFGLFGGKWGDYLIPFLQALEKPSVTTLHSIIPNPDEHLKKVMKIIAGKSNALVVMNKLSSELLFSKYNTPQYKIHYIPHGIPQAIYSSPKKHKKDLGLEKNLVISTFGFLSPNKGIEYAIRALPKAVKKFPNILYLVIGETHPNIRRTEGEKYRNFLNKEIERLGLKNNVKFYNKYVSLEEIVKFLQASDIYLACQTDRSQSVSGTISYALGCARPVIATATEYAKHIINKENGILVNPKNSNEISKAILYLASNEKARESMGAAAYQNTRPMIWPNVAKAYFKLYKKFAEVPVAENKLPEIKFDHITRLTDNFSIIQHARYSKPAKRFGYSLDDAARALIAVSMHYKKKPSSEMENLMKTYIGFIEYCQRKNGSFCNIVSFKKKRDKTSEEDVQGRAIWSLGYASSTEYLPQEIRQKAQKCFKKSLPLLKKIKAPRSVAFAMCGLYYYLRLFPKESKLKKDFKKMADRLVNLYVQNASYNWHWFEDFFSYSNSKLPEALFAAYDLLKTEKYLKIAKDSLKFLDSITFQADYYAPIGQNGWYFKNKERSYFDQQPEDTATMVQTKILAYKITKKRKYFEDALMAFQWFLGKNYLELMVYDEATGGCHDGLSQRGLNLNQGAESTISYLMARLSFENEKIL